MITIDPHGHLTHTYLLLLVLSLSASHRPRVPITAPLSYHHDSHCQTFDNVTTHQIAYADLARRTQLVREEYNCVSVLLSLGNIQELCT
jgi:hypothetical protein